MVSTKILITGLLGGSSGKTYLAIAVVYALRSTGLRPGVFKPLSIHNWFTEYNTTLENIRSGSLFCGDAVKLRQIAGIKEPYELLNPVDFLVSPLDPSVFINARVPDLYYSFSSDLTKTAIVARFTRYGDEKLHNLYLVNKWALQRKMLIVDEEVVDRITRKADEIVQVNDSKMLNHLVSKYFTSSVSTCLKNLGEKHAIIVIESYSDIAWPLPLKTRVDVVLVTSPGRVLVYDANKFRMAVELKKPLRGLYTTVKLSDIIGLLRPLKHFKVGPTHTAEIPESYTVRKYAGVINFLINELEKSTSSF